MVKAFPRFPSLADPLSTLQPLRCSVMDRLTSYTNSSCCTQCQEKRHSVMVGPMLLYWSNHLPSHCYLISAIVLIIIAAIQSCCSVHRVFIPIHIAFLVTLQAGDTLLNDCNGNAVHALRKFNTPQRKLATRRLVETAMASSSPALLL